MLVSGVVNGSCHWVPEPTGLTTMASDPTVLWELGWSLSSDAHSPQFLHQLLMLFQAIIGKPHIYPGFGLVPGPTPTPRHGLFQDLQVQIFSKTLVFSKTCLDFSRTCLDFSKTLTWICPSLDLIQDISKIAS